MRVQLAALLGPLLMLFCILVVFWQVWKGTSKYLAAPVANKIFSVEAELPVITVCHRKKGLRMGTKIRLTYEDFKDGKFLPYDSENISAEELFEEAIAEHYYLLDITGQEDISKTNQFILLNFLS